MVTYMVGIAARLSKVKKDRVKHICQPSRITRGSHGSLEISLCHDHDHGNNCSQV